jgi:DNA-binding protein WhiA
MSATAPRRGGSATAPRHPSARPDRELVAAIRAELAAIDPIRACDRTAQLLGLGDGPGPRDVPLARLVHRLGGPVELHPFDWDGASEHCRMAWLRGRFLARGSLSLASGRTHLEFVVEPAEAPELAQRLRAIGLPAATRVRRGRGVVTWKSAGQVTEFLQQVGAGASVLELESRQVSRELRGDLNRVLNAEAANLQRAVLAAEQQLAAIEILAADGRLAEQPRPVRLVAEARVTTPEATLSELAERAGVHRSAAQRALERLERLAFEGQRGGRRPSRPGARALA